MASPGSTDFYLSETPAERERRIRELFDILDRQRQGHLDREAIRKGFTQMTHLPARNKYVNELLERCDTSHDGLVDFDEFQTYVTDKERELWHLFQKIDQNGDGQLLPSDLEAALKDAGIEISQDEFLDFMQLMDLGIECNLCTPRFACRMLILLCFYLDGNGVIDFYDFKNFLLVSPPAWGLDAMCALIAGGISCSSCRRPT